MLFDWVPCELLEPLVRKLLERALLPGGRLIVGAYGSAHAGEPVRTRFAWIEAGT